MVVLYSEIMQVHERGGDQYSLLRQCGDIQHLNNGVVKLASRLVQQVYSVHIQILILNIN